MTTDLSTLFGIDCVRNDQWLWQPSGRVTARRSGAILASAPLETTPSAQIRCVPFDSLLFASR